MYLDSLFIRIILLIFMFIAIITLGGLALIFIGIIVIPDILLLLFSVYNFINKNFSQVFASEQGVIIFNILGTFIALIMYLSILYAVTSFFPKISFIINWGIVLIGMAIMYYGNSELHQFTLLKNKFISDIIIHIILILISIPITKKRVSILQGKSEI